MNGLVWNGGVGIEDKNYGSTESIGMIKILVEKDIECQNFC